MKIVAVVIFLMSLATGILAQTSKHLPASPQYKDQRVLNHLESLENQLQAVRQSELTISFSGWSNRNAQAAAEKDSNQNFQLIQTTLSEIEDIRAAGTYSARDLFLLYEGTQSIERTADSLSYDVFLYEHNVQPGVETLRAADALLFSISDLERDIQAALDLQGDAFMTLQMQSPCKQ
jgi:hypothetical protein